jgi:hypothetical protein
MMMVVVMMVMVHDNHDLRLRCIRDCKAEEKCEPEKILFHSLLWRFASLFSRAILTASQKSRIASRIDARDDSHRATPWLMSHA